MKKIILVFLFFTLLKVEAQTSTFSAVDNLFAQGRYQLALKKLEQIQTPSFLSNFKKAIIYESIDNHKKTVLFLEKALTFKDDTQAKLKLAKAYQKLGVLNKSIAIYEEVSEKDSLNLLLKYQLGKLYLVTRKATKAISIFKNLIKKDSLNAHYSYQLGLGYAIKKDRNKMINSFLKTYNKDSTYLKAIVKLATSFNKLNDRDSSQIFVEKGLVLNSNQISLNKLKINQLYRDKKYLEAIPFLLNLDTIVTNDTYPTSMLGRIYYNVDSLQKAKRYFKKLFRLDRENFKSHTYLGHIAVKEKQYKTAQRNYRVATFIGKDNRDEEYYGLATAYYELGDAKLAIKNFEKAFLENYKNYKALYQLAKISDDYYKDKKIAYRHYTKYINNFEEYDKDITNFVKRRIIEIKKEYFLKGENLE